MKKAIAIGTQDFEKIITEQNFYIDKTMLIKDWWDSKDSVTLITRPRRFGKTLNMSMLNCFFSINYENRADLFEGLNIWQYEEYRKIRGTYPVIFLSFANAKRTTYDDMIEKFCDLISDMYIDYKFILDSDVFADIEKEKYMKAMRGLKENEAADSINKLCRYLSKYYGKKVIVLLDEYDTPMHEAYTCGFWNEIVSFMRSFFNSTFKTNPYLERAVMTGITRVSKESMFSDLNNLKVITMTSNKYSSYFGFTEKEVFDTMDIYGYTNKDEVKYWYDGFTIGETKDIYNPWSVTNFIDEGKLKTYWADTSSNDLVSTLLMRGNKETKAKFEQLINGKAIYEKINEEIVYGHLSKKESAVWSLLAASGYLKISNVKNGIYELSLTNYEIKSMFEDMILEWFDVQDSYYNDFLRAFEKNNLKEMNIYMNKLTLSMMSYFDSGKQPSENEPERFYHGFVLGLLVEMRNRYLVVSNHESGYGRYDIMLEPKNVLADNGIIIEFKVFDKDEEETLNDTVSKALEQIEEMKYEQMLIDKGVPKEKIRKYGFAFKGKKVLIGTV